jgi:D-alanyl-D-alanine carboxypeptidase
VTSSVRAIVLLVLSVVWPISAHAAVPLAASPEQIRALVANELIKREVPGAALVVLRGDNIWLESGFGHLGDTGATPVTPETLFQLGSISKSFLAALVLTLSQQGKFSLDDSIGARLPAARHLSSSITIRHLLNHTSGLREQFLLPGIDQGVADLSRPKNELYALVAKAPADYPAGTRWSYSNTNYTLLAMLVEEVSAMPYEIAMQQIVFRPLGLSSLSQCRSVPDGRGEARGHVRDRAGKIVPSAPENMNWIRGDGGLCANALDLARWMRALTVEQPAPMAVAAPMKVPTTLSNGKLVEYGYALSTIAPDRVSRFGHNGAMLGFSASAVVYPTYDLTIVVLANRGDVRTEAIERQVARKLLGIAEPIRKPIELSEAQRREVEGAYDIGVFDITISARGTQQWLKSPPPGPSGPLVHVGRCVFVLEQEPDANELAVSCDKEGNLQMMMGAMYWYGQKKP